MPGGVDDYPLDAVRAVPARAIAAAWRRELPGVDTESIEVITPLWRVAKRFADDRRRTLQRLGIEPATLDLLGTLRRAGPPYTLTTRQLTAATQVSAGAISQRVARAEAAGLVIRAPSSASRRGVDVTLTRKGHALIDRVVRRLLEHEATLLAALTAGQRRSLARLLEILCC